MGSSCAKLFTCKNRSQGRAAGTGERGKEGDGDNKRGISFFASPTPSLFMPVSDGLSIESRTVLNLSFQCFVLLFNPLLQ